jgi:tyrosinase
MKFLHLFSALSLACTFTSAHPAASSPLEERQQQLVITNAVSGPVYPRLEIRTLSAANNYAQWSLFILALRQWQQESQSDPSSFFGVAKIHGVPRQNYNNVGQCFGCGGTDGYCTHDSILFPTWHRAYVALWEQQFLIRVNRVANSFVGTQFQGAMQQAAVSMRWPFWDWAAKAPAGTPVLPYVVTNRTVKVQTPTGQQIVGNPLYQYNYTSSGGMYYYPYTDYRATYRYPYSNAANAGSNNARAVSAFGSARSNLADQVYGLLTQCKTWQPFSNDNADNSNTGCSNSLEGIHNNIHVLAGGQGSSSAAAGHMSVPPTASFDPLFFLHHANVDRLFAMWQAINPSQYSGSARAPGSTWTIAQGDTNNEFSNLTPFLKDTSGNFWTGLQVRSWNTTFAYTYPEFVATPGDAGSVASIASKLYSRGATATAGSIKRDAAAAPAPNAAAEATPAPVLEARDTTTYHYVANIQTPRHYLKGSYTIYIFNGKPASEDPETWITDERMIGPMGVFAHSSMASNKVVIAGSVPLTSTLSSIAGTGLLADLSIPLVSAYLKANLQWRIHGPNGESVDPASIPGFVVSVVCAPMTVSSDPRVLPIYGQFQTLVDVTTGLVGGLDKTTKLLGNVVGGLLNGLLG